MINRAAEPHRPSRRFATGTAVVAVLAGALVAAPQATANVAAPPATTAAAAGCTAGISLGVMAPISGDNALFGAAVVRGAELAIARHNRAHPGCAVRLVRADSQGDPSRAPAAASRLIHNRAVLGVVGPTFSGESLATGKAYARAGLVTITPSATNPATTAQHWRTYVRGIANDNAVGTLGGRFLAAKLKAKRVCVVHDDSSFSITTANAAARALGTRRVCTIGLRTPHPNYAAATRTALAKKSGTILYTGYSPEAAAFVRTLRAAGFRGAYVVGDGSYGADYIRRAGRSGQGTYVVAGVSPRTMSTSLAASYKHAYRTTIPAYTNEAYDVTNIELAGIDHGVRTRAAMLKWIHAYRGKGVTRTFRFTSRGELTDPTAWAYRVRKNSLATVSRVS